MWVDERWRRRRTAVVFLLTAAVVAVFSAAATYLLTAGPRTVTHDVMETAAIDDSSTSIGVAEGSGLYWSSEEDIIKTLDTLKSIGVQNVRIGIPWGLVESQPLTKPGDYDWDKVDFMINEAEKRGLGILGTMTSSALQYGIFPPGAVHPTDPAKFDAFVAQFADFAAAAAERYQGVVSSYEIWNEPNGVKYFAPVDAEGYTKLLKAAYGAIKGVDPSAMVIGGVVGAGRTLPGGLALNPVTFIQQMYEAGAQGYFDALSFHPYHYTLPFSEGASVIDSPLRQLQQIRKLMEQNGDAALKIWISEFGEPTTTLTDGKTVVTPEMQAALIEDLLRTWQTIDGAADWAGPIFLYTTRDLEAGSTSSEDNYGLFYNDWLPKPVVAVIQQIIEELQLPPGPDPDPGPVEGAVSSVFKQLAQILETVMSFVPKLINQVITVVIKVVTSIIGGASSSAAQNTEVASVTASADGVAAQAKRSIAEPAEATASPSGDSETAAAKAAPAEATEGVAEESVQPTAEQPVADTTVTEPAAEESASPEQEATSPEEDATSPEEDATDDTGTTDGSADETGVETDPVSVDQPEEDDTPAEPVVTDREDATEPEKATTPNRSAQDPDDTNRPTGVAASRDESDNDSGAQSDNDSAGS